ncbi:MAG: HEAT repeat domain-containing protein [Candidatus Lokiarchaeota archaeon]|nr:HEAT repeat domain-containing protein [Candidatus Lokiarchaeota archaeon]
MHREKEKTIKDFLKELTIENRENLTEIIVADPEKVQEVIEFLSDKKEDLRINAASILGQFGDVRTVDPLIRALSDKKKTVRREAADSLGELQDEKAVEPLIKALKDKDAGVRMFAARALGNFGDKRALDPILKLLEDNDEGVRQWTCDSLGELGIYSQDVIEALKRHLEDKDKRTRLCVAKALGRFGDKSGFEVAMEILEGGRVRKGDVFLKTHAVEALGYIGDLGAKPLLTEAKESSNRFLRQAAIKALERLE